MQVRSIVYLASAAAVSLIHSPASAATRFDGNWSVEVITEKGDCDTYRYSLAIEDGRVRYAGAGDFVVSGKVAGNGSINGSIAKGDRLARVQGNLEARSGGGRWSTASCSGRWVGERRG